MKKIYFVTGSQELYGEETLRAVAADSGEIAAYLNKRASGLVGVEGRETVKSSAEIAAVCRAANADADCVGMIVWMHTFSPAKMWLEGLRLLDKPLLHFATQYNEKLPYGTIDMDFMNLNQSAHGDREFGFAAARLRKARKTVVGFWKEEETLSEIFEWARCAEAAAFSRTLKICRFGDNMRNVAVTEGDKVEAQLKFGWQVDYHAIGELVEEISKVTDAEAESRLAEIRKEFPLDTDDVSAVLVQVKEEIALRRFLTRGGYGGFTTNFEDLFGLRQLPGLAVQLLMKDGFGFGAEGDWKTAAMTAVLKRMGAGKNGATAFMEDYTYDLTKGEELVLGAHMLEVDPQIAATKPKIQVHPLGIGDREAPARLVFEGASGSGRAISLVDIGGRFRLISAEIELVKAPASTPKLPVASVMWKLKPDFKTGVGCWLTAGGAHHTTVTTQLSRENIRDFATAFGIELVEIDESTDRYAFEDRLFLADAVWNARR